MRRAHPGSGSQAVARSARWFQRLLAAYPAEHRRQYGPLMTQLFRDQCRDAWTDGRRWGLTWLWLRVLPDLMKTSVLEHISTLKKRKTMFERAGGLLRPRTTPLAVFIPVFAAVFLLVVAVSTIITFLMPESFSSSARLLLRQGAAPEVAKTDSAAPAGRYDSYYIQTQFGIIQSEAVLGKVIEDLDLNDVWSRKFSGSERLKTSETMAILKGRIDLRPLRNTWLVEIRVFSDQPEEAAKLANAIARSYQEWSLAHSTPVDIVDTATPILRPVRPNKPLNIAVGLIVGMVLAGAAGAGMAGLAVWLGRKSRGTGVPPGAGDVPPTRAPRGLAAQHPTESSA